MTDPPDIANPIHLSEEVMAITEQSKNSNENREGLPIGVRESRSAEEVQTFAQHGNQSTTSAAYQGVHTIEKSQKKPRARSNDIWIKYRLELLRIQTNSASVHRSYWAPRGEYRQLWHSRGMDNNQILDPFYRDSRFPLIESLEFLSHQLKHHEDEAQGRFEMKEALLFLEDLETNESTRDEFGHEARNLRSVVLRILRSAFMT